MTSINIKVCFPNEQSKVFRVPVNFTVNEFLLQIQHKIKQLDVGVGQNYGLFKSACENRVAHWLNPNRLIKYYNLTNESVVEYKRKYRMLRVSLLDDSVYSLVIDSSKKIKKIIAHVGKKLKLQDYDQYGLKKSSKEDDRWLNMEKTLYDEGVSDDDCLIFMKRLFANDYDIDMEDPFQLHLIYIQAVRNFINDKYSPLLSVEVVDLASTLLQVIYGSYDPKKKMPESFANDKVLPISFRKDKKIIRDVIKEWIKLSGYSKNKAKFRFVRFARSLKDYGVTFYEVTEKQKNKSCKLLFGISRDKLMKVNRETRKPIKEWNVEHLHRWSYSKNYFTLDFGDYEDSYTVFVTDKAEEISHIISGYISIIIKTKTKYQQNEDKNYVESKIDNISSTSGYAINITPELMKLSETEKVSNVSRIVDSYLAFPQAQGLTVSDINSAVNALKTLDKNMQDEFDHYKSSGAISSDQWSKQLQTYKKQLSNDVKNLLNYVKNEKKNLNTIDNYSRSIHSNTMGLSISSKNIASMNHDNSIMTMARNMNDSIKELLEYVANSENKSSSTEELSRAEKYFDINDKTLNLATNGQYIDDGSYELISKWIDNLDYVVYDLIGPFLNDIRQELDDEKNSQLDDKFDSLKSSLKWTKKYLNSMLLMLTNPKIREKFKSICHDFLNQCLSFTNKMEEMQLSDENKERLMEIIEYLRNFLQIINESLECIELKTLDNDETNLNTISYDILKLLPSVRSNIDNPKLLSVNSDKLVDLTKKLVTQSSSVSTLFDKEKQQSVADANENMSKYSEKLADLSKSINENLVEDSSTKLRIKELLNRVEYYNYDIQCKVGNTAAYLKLSYCTKVATSRMLMVQALSKNLLLTSKSSKVHKFLSKSQQALFEGMKEMLSALQLSIKNLDDVNLNEGFLSVCQNCILAYQNSVVGLKHTLEYMSNPETKSKIKYVSDEANDTIVNLEQASNVASNLRNEKEIEQSIIKFEIVGADLNYAQLNVSRGLLAEVNGVKRDGAFELLSLTIRDLSALLDCLVTSAKSGANLYFHIQEISDKISQLFTSAHTMASVIPNLEIQKNIISLTKNALDDMFQLICSSRLLVSNHEDQELLASVNKDHTKVNSTMSSLLAAAKGVNTTKLDNSIQLIVLDKARLTELSENNDAECVNETLYEQNVEQLIAATKAVSTSVLNLINSSRENFYNVDSNVSSVTTTMKLFLRVGSAVHNCSKDKVASEEVLSKVNFVADNVLEAMETVKRVIANRDALSVSMLNCLKTKITTSVTQLLGGLEKSTYCNCEEAIKIINASLANLDSNEAEQSDICPESSSLSIMPAPQLFESLEGKLQALMSVAQRMFTASHISTEKLGLYSKESAVLYKSLVSFARSFLHQYGQSDVANSGNLASAKSYLSELKKCCAFLLTYSDATVVSKTMKKTTSAVSKLASLLVAPESSNVGGDNRFTEYTENIKRDLDVLTDASSLAIESSNVELLQSLNLSAKSMSQSIDELEKSLASSSSNANASAENSDSKYNHVIEDVLSTTRLIGNKYIDLIRASMEVNLNRDNNEACKQLLKVTNTLASAISQLVNACSSINPSYQVLKEFELFLQRQQDHLELTSGDSEIESTTSPSLKFVTTKSLLYDSTKCVAKQLNKFSSVIKFELFKVTGDLKAFKQSIEQFTEHSKDVVKMAPTDQYQKQIASNSKLFLSNLREAIQAGCELATKQQDAGAMRKFNVQIEKSASVLSRLLGALENNESIAADITEVLNQVANDIVSLDERAADTVDAGEIKGNLSYNELLEELTETMLPIVLEHVGHFARVGADVGSVGLNAVLLGSSMEKWILFIRAAIGKCSGNGVQASSGKVVVGAKEFLSSIIELLQHAREYVFDVNSFDKMQSASLAVSEKLNEFLNLLKLSALGQIECDQAMEVIGKSLSQISSNAITAQAGQLKADQSDELGPSVLQEQIFRILHDFMYKMTELGESKNTSQDCIGKKALAFANQFQSATAYTISFSKYLTDSNLQLELLGVLKVTGIRYQQFVLATRDAERNRKDDSAQQTQVTSEQEMIKSIENLIEIVKSSAAKSTAGERQLEISRQKIINFIQNVPGYDTANSDNLISASQDTIKTLMQLVLAKSQEAIVSTSLETEECVENLANIAATIAKSAPMDIQRDIKKALDKVGSSLYCLMNREKIGNQCGNLEDVCGEVSKSIENLVRSMRHIPQLEGFNINETGELELLTNLEIGMCSKIVEEASSILLARKPNLIDPNDPHVVEKEAIYNSIFEAVVEITEASKLLMKTSALIQQENRTSKIPSKSGTCYHKDPTWVNGLISACRGVADSVKHLVEAASDVSLGQSEQEILVISSRMTAATTAQLVAASRVRASPNSPLQIKLKQSSKAIKSAIKKLVDAAQNAIQLNRNIENNDELQSGNSTECSIKAKFDQQIRILKLEAEIEKERHRLAVMNKMQYNH